MPLPEEMATKDVLIKIEGNSAVITVRWKLVDNNGVQFSNCPSGAGML